MWQRPARWRFGSWAADEIFVVNKKIFALKGFKANIFFDYNGPQICIVNSLYDFLKIVVPARFIYAILHS